MNEQGSISPNFVCQAKRRRHTALSKKFGIQFHQQFCINENPQLHPKFMCAIHQFHAPFAKPVRQKKLLFLCAQKWLMKSTPDVPQYIRSFYQWFGVLFLSTGCNKRNLESVAPNIFLLVTVFLAVNLHSKKWSLIRLPQKDQYQVYFFFFQFTIFLFERKTNGNYSDQ